MSILKLLYDFLNQLILAIDKLFKRDRGFCTNDPFDRVNLLDNVFGMFRIKGPDFAGDVKLATRNIGYGNLRDFFEFMANLVYV